jgi:hypothetical protein
MKTPANQSMQKAVRNVGTLQRKCSCGGRTAAAGECENCKKKRVQRRESQGQGPAAVPPIVHEVLSSPGKPLDKGTREFFEPRFGHDFSKIRVHTGAKAAESAKAVNAHAYTVANNVVFASGRYAPEANAGRELIAHELVHTIQQQGAVVSPTLEISDPHESSETEAERAAQSSIKSGQAPRPQPSSIKLSRQTQHSDKQEEEKKKKEREEEIRRLTITNQRGPSPDSPEQQAEKERLQAEKERLEKRKQELHESAKSTPYGRENPTVPSNWGWGAPETDNLKQECKVTGMERSDFLSFLSTMPAGPPAVVFGETAIVPQNAVPPQIAAVQADGGFKLKPTHAEMPPVYSAFTKAGTFVEGKQICTNSECGAKKGSGDQHYEITAAGAERLQAGEMEHCNDYREAFGLTLQLYASIINNLAAHERVYSSERQAIEEATQQVGVKPGEMNKKFEQMCEKSLLRDSNHWHEPNYRFPADDHYHQLCKKENDCRALEVIDAKSLPQVDKHPFEELAMPASKSGGKP